MERIVSLPPKDDTRVSRRRCRSPRPAKRGEGYGVRGYAVRSAPHCPASRDIGPSPLHPLSPSFRRGEGTEEITDHGSRITDDR